MKQLIDKLRHKHSLTGEEYAILLTCQDADTLMYLQQQAQEVTLAHFGNAILSVGLSRWATDVVTIAIIAE